MYKSLILKHPQVRFRGLGWFVWVNQLINLMGVGGGGPGLQKIFFPQFGLAPRTPPLDPLLLKRGGRGGGGAKCLYIIAFATLYKLHSQAIIASLFLQLHCMALTKLPFCSTLCIEISERTIRAQVKLSPRTYWKPFRTLEFIPMGSVPWWGLL